MGMSYSIMVPIPITSQTEVKIMVGSPSLDTTILNNVCALADKQIYALTGRDDWDSVDSKTFGLLQSIGAAYATWLILSGWDKGEYGDKAKNMYNNYKDLLDEFHNTPPEPETDNPNYAIISSPDTIPALNNELSHFLSDY